MTGKGFAARLRDQVDLDALGAELLAVVHHIMQPAGRRCGVGRKLHIQHPRAPADHLPMVK